jgi:hypothetical protein
MTPWEWDLLFKRHTEEIRFRAKLAGATFPEEKKPESPDQRLQTWARYQALTDKQQHYG